MLSVVAQWVSLPRSVMAGPFSMRLSWAWVMPTHPATIFCRST